VTKWVPWGIGSGGRRAVCARWGRHRGDPVLVHLPPPPPPTPPFQQDPASASSQHALTSRLGSLASALEPAAMLPSLQATSTLPLP
jgi:hypothetical protein